MTRRDHHGSTSKPRVEEASAAEALEAAEEERGTTAGEERAGTGERLDAGARAQDRASEAQHPAGAPARERLPDTPEQAEDLPPFDEVDALRAERDALRDQLLRRAAEFDNLRKRNAREWQEHRERAAAEVLRAMLEIADNLERALQVPEEDSAGLRKGVELIGQQLHSVLTRFGVEPIEAAGKPFDPNEHDAVLMVDSDEVASQHVAEVVQGGYKLHGVVLRPARVTVSRGPKDA